MLCVEAITLGAHAFADVGLAEGHAPCEVQVLLVRSDGAFLGPVRATCPTGAVSHWRVDGGLARAGTFQSVASIKRTTDGTVVLRERSPFVTVG